MPIKIQVADASSNNGYYDLGAVLKAKLVRTSGAGPGVLSLSCGADPKLDAGNGAGTFRRFYPHLNIRVVEGTPNDGTPQSDATRKYFEGRIDDARIVENDVDGRIWQISARDRLASLADNFIDKGQWSSTTLTGRSIDKAINATWLANYVGDYTGSAPDHPGEYRRWIIADLAMNVIHDGNIGISDVEFGIHGHTSGGAPNSKKIEWNADNNAMINILDAIRGLAAADPWFSAGSTGGGGEVDGKDLAKQKFPEFSGFGGELQVRCNVISDNPAILEYYKRGDFLSSMNYVYGRGDSFTRGYIVGYDFSRMGMDIYSRTRIVGKGEGQYTVNVGPNGAVGGSDQSLGQGIVVPGMETSWAPLNGLFRIRRENPNPRAEALVGEPGYEDQPDEKQAIRARALRDQAYASLWSATGSRAVQGSAGGDNQGQIVIAGPPNNTVDGGVLRVGTIVGITIPQYGFDYNDDDPASPSNGHFLIQSWSYDFPVDQTTLTLARAAAGLATTQLLGSLRNAQDSQSAHNDYYDSGWVVSDAGGTVTIKHSLGVKPSKITIEAAKWDGKEDQNGNPLPVYQTTVTVPATGWDASQGQNHGYFVSASDAQKTTIKFAHWLAFSDGTGEWLKHDDPNTLIRIRVAP